MLLNVVFWDYPEYTNEARLRNELIEKRSEAFTRWVLHRFMIHGRVVDTFKIFNLQDIEEALSTLPHDSYAARKWKRIIEVAHERRRK